MTVVEYAGRMSNRHAWLCCCTCGNEKVVLGGNLKSGGVKSCGCLMQPEDLTGRKFNSWTVLAHAGKKKNQHYWNCRCECGTQRAVAGEPLKSGASKSCGQCREFTHEDLVGQTFGSWTVIKDLGRGSWGYHFLCRCVCGIERSVRGQNLKKGLSNSCGCKNPRNSGKKRTKKKGRSKS